MATWTAPRTWVAGETVTAALLNTHVRDNLLSIGQAWTAYTPTLAQGVSTDIAKTVNYARYLSIGKLTVVQMLLSPTAAGTAGSAITASLPVTAAYGSLIVGAGRYIDAGSAEYVAICYLESATALALIRTDATVSGRMGVDPNIAVANSDVFEAFAVYEAA